MAQAHLKKNGSKIKDINLKDLQTNPILKTCYTRFQSKPKASSYRVYHKKQKKINFAFF